MLDMYPGSYPGSIYGMPVYEIQPKYEPVLQLSEDFKWCTDEFRAKQNAYLLKVFGTRDISIVPKNQVFMFRNSIIMRPEHTAMLMDMTA